MWSVSVTTYKGYNKKVLTKNSYLSFLNFFSISHLVHQYLEMHRCINIYMYMSKYII